MGGLKLPIRLIEQCRHRPRITLVNRFVDDDEVVGYFAGADAVVLPYHRSSASSPASVAMANGLPLIVTAVGGLPKLSRIIKARSWCLRKIRPRSARRFCAFRSFAGAAIRILTPGRMRRKHTRN